MSSKKYNYEFKFFRTYIKGSKKNEDIFFEEIQKKISEHNNMNNTIEYENKLKDYTIDIIKLLLTYKFFSNIFSYFFIIIAIIYSFIYDYNYILLTLILLSPIFKIVSYILNKKLRMYETFYDGYLN